MRPIKQRLCMGLLGAALAVSLSVPGLAAVEALNVNGQDLWIQAKARVVEGTTYASIRTLAEVLVPSARVSWQDGAARMEGDGWNISARPGDPYLLVNDRALYIPHGVQADSGSVLVPVRALTEVLGGRVDWSSQEGVTLIPGKGVPERASYTEDELFWMARIIFAESRGEPLLGKLAVGTVVLNRVADPQFPNTIYGVIFDRKWGVQFEPVANGTIYNTPDAECFLAAKMVLDGARVAEDSLYFLAPELTDNHWTMENREFVVKIGAHWFYR